MQHETSEFKDGVRDSIPVVISASPFGALFGAVAVDIGLTNGEAIFMSASVFAGASQFVAVGLWSTPLLVFSIIFSVFAVNFRHILYSASLGRKMDAFSGLQKAVAFFFLVDPQWASSEARAATRTLTFKYYMGMALPIYTSWLIATTIGVVFGSLISDTRAFGFDMILPIYFLGLLMGFRARSNWLPTVLVAGAAAILAWHFVGEPWHISIGGLAGIAVAAMRALPKDKGTLSQALAAEAAVDEAHDGAAEAQGDR